MVQEIRSIIVRYYYNFVQSDLKRFYLTFSLSDDDLLCGKRGFCVQRGLLYTTGYTHVDVGVGVGVCVGGRTRACVKRFEIQIKFDGFHDVLRATGAVYIEIQVHISANFNTHNNAQRTCITIYTNHTTKYNAQNCTREYLSPFDGA